MNLRTCVAPAGRFIIGAHKPAYNVQNIREEDYIGPLGEFQDGSLVENHPNFPAGDIAESNADWIYEIPNAFPFWGATYISKPIADGWAQNPLDISLPARPEMSFTQTASQWFSESEWSMEKTKRVFNSLPESIQMAVAGNSTDPEDLELLAELSCEFTHDPISKYPTGLVYVQDENGTRKPIIRNYALFKVLANNFHLPDVYKEIMVLKPGAQGDSEIVGEWLTHKNSSHVFEYLRRNSYIPWGHYAANMANDSVRYRIHDLSMEDMTGIRHLYYQRTYLRVAEMLGIPFESERKRLDLLQLEALRRKIINNLTTTGSTDALPFTSTLWGWNFGFDYAPSKYRLHASHQQIHQQYALVPETVAAGNPDTTGLLYPAYACGDLVKEFIRQYHSETGKKFFETYIQAIRSNERTCGDKNRESSLIVYENEKVLVFVPKAQTSQWELQIMPHVPVGNILEADTTARKCIDEAMLVAMRVLEAMGARMITGIEFSKRFDSSDEDQRLLYCFLPRIPESPGAFSETQLRWITNHYPEDFAIACRANL
ncbi:MAG TPA: hypothetical protein HPQ03_02560 [Deltaproteobacteria bacterium]|nr:hypothetical protein [Deltaproteobacteria bacterium]